VHIVSALFIDSFEMRQVDGPATRIDLTGVHFSLAAPSPVPVTIEPHLMGLIYCPPEDSGKGVFEVIFRSGLNWPEMSAHSPSSLASSRIGLFEARWK